MRARGPFATTNLYGQFSDIIVFSVPPGCYLRSQNPSFALDTVIFKQRSPSNVS